MIERLSHYDDSIFQFYAEHIQRYQFAADYCRGKTVFDAGCGIGYGSHFLAMNGAASVVGADLSEEALEEAGQNYRLPNLRFERRDVEALTDATELHGQFDVVVNFENIEHLHHPEALVAGASRLLRNGSGRFITSNPNGAVSVLNPDGTLQNEFHVKERTADEFVSLLSEQFDRVSMYGQWLSYTGRLRHRRAKELFEQLLESYYNPMSRIGRYIRTLAGKKTSGPPEFTALDAYPDDYVIFPLEPTPFQWQPAVLIAVCETTAARE